MCKYRIIHTMLQCTGTCVFKTNYGMPKLLILQSIIHVHVHVLDTCVQACL